MRLFYTVSEVCERLEVSASYIRNEIKEGRLAAYKIGKEWRIRIESIHNFIESKKINN